MYQWSDLYCFPNKKLCSFSKDKGIALGCTCWLGSFACSKLHQEWEAMVLGWRVQIQRAG